jgi:hypothetical protein
MVSAALMLSLCLGVETEWACRRLLCGCLSLTTNG